MFFLCVSILVGAFIVGHPLANIADYLCEIANEIHRLRGGR